MGHRAPLDFFFLAGRPLIRNLGLTRTFPWTGHDGDPMEPTCRRIPTNQRNPGALRVVLRKYNGHGIRDRFAKGVRHLPHVNWNSVTPERILYTI